MIKFKKWTILLYILMFIIGCTPKSYNKQKSIFIVFKTSSFKYADLGFLYENLDEIKVELYGSGEALFSLIIYKSSVCMTLFKCMNSESFNAKILSQYYPNNLLNNIFRGEKIFKGLNFQKSGNGFTQNINAFNKYNIEYTVLKKQIIFRDKINHILIKIKEVE